MLLHAELFGLGNVIIFELTLANEKYSYVETRNGIVISGTRQNVLNVYVIGLRTNAVVQLYIVSQRCFVYATTW